MAKKRTKKIKKRVIKDYDRFDTSEIVDTSKPLTFENIGLKLPDVPPTQVVSIRLPSTLLNELKALGSQQDIPYQALIKLFLFRSIANFKKKLPLKK